MPLYENINLQRIIYQKPCVVDVPTSIHSGLCLSQTWYVITSVIIVLNIHTKGFKYYYEMVNDYHSLYRVRL